MLLGTNITTANSVLKLEGNSTNVWTSPAYTVNLDVYNNGNVGISGINSTYRYWRLVVTDVTISDILIGYCYIGDRLQLPGMDPSINLSYNTNTAVSYSISQQTYADEGENYFSSSFSFPLIYDYSYNIDGKSIASREDILEFWFTNKGATPIVLIIWDNSRDRFPPIFGLVSQNSMAFKMSSNQQSYSMDFNFIETK